MRTPVSLGIVACSYATNASAVCRDRGNRHGRAGLAAGRRLVYAGPRGGARAHACLPALPYAARRSLPVLPVVRRRPAAQARGVLPAAPARRGTRPARLALPGRARAPGARERVVGR